MARWINVITTEQGLDLDQYKRDAVWPSAALKKLTSSSIDVTQEDINKGFEANYGERVRCRAIVLDNFRRAQEVWDKARSKPSVEYFSQLAEEYSVEPTSKALRGEVPPLQRHGGQPQLEEVAFSLQPGQISGIINVGETYIILRCEGRTERLDVDQDDVREILVRDIYEKKLRRAMSEKFELVHATARVDNYLARSSHAPLQQADATVVRRDAAIQPTSGATRR
jgi:parvulin-like peptidyl-prolyl isomerase